MDPATDEFRDEIIRVEHLVKQIKASRQSADLGVQLGSPLSDRAMMLASTKLALQHVEDARTHLGKVIQAFEGGVPVYDQEKTP